MDKRRVGVESVLRMDVIPNDLYSDDGILLAKRGTHLTAGQKSKLKSMQSNGSEVYWGISSAPARVYVPRNTETPSIKPADDCLIAKSGFDNYLKISDEFKERAAASVEYIFKNLSSSEIASRSSDVASSIVSVVAKSDSVSMSLSDLKVSNEYTYKHCMDVSVMSVVVGKAMGLSEREQQRLGVAGILHDVGKSRISNDILDKNGKLTNEEFDIIKKHPIFSYEILRENDDVDEYVRQAVLQHHEKANGLGYPLGLHSDRINKYAKILTVVDVFDALVTERPYHKPYSSATAIEMLMGMADSFDMDVLQSFLRCVVLYPIGSTVRLSNGDDAVVLSNTPDFILRPTVRNLRTGSVCDLMSLEYANLVIQ